MSFSTRASRPASDACADRTRTATRRRRAAALAALVSLAAAGALLPGADAAGPSGAGYTTFDAVQEGCLDSPNGINCNNYASKGDVYMSGGPSAGGLSDGSYYFAVLTPGAQNGGFVDGADGNLSDTTAGATAGDAGSGDPASNRTFTVAGKEIASYDGTHPTGTSPTGRSIVQLTPYDDTNNPGGVYVLAICRTGATTPADCKFDAFRIRSGDGGGEPPQPNGRIAGSKYYDANLNGQRDAGELGIANWPIDLADGTVRSTATDSSGDFAFSSLPADTYLASEQQAGAPWVQTGNTADQTSHTGGNFLVSLQDFVYEVLVTDEGTSSGAHFGNVCRLPTNGRTMGFWSNKNGQALVNAADLAALRELPLVTKGGTAFDPTSYSAYRTWLLNAEATNMAYMLSAQLSALVLSVREGFVDGNATIFGDGRTVQQIISDAVGLLADGNTPADDPNRLAQEAIKNLIDAINSNQSLVLPLTPAGCPAPVFAP